MCVQVCVFLMFFQVSEEHLLALSLSLSLCVYVCMCLMLFQVSEEHFLALIQSLHVRVVRAWVCYGFDGR